jgi:hypothetical protein
MAKGNNPFRVGAVAAGLVQSASDDELREALALVEQHRPGSHELLRRLILEVPEPDYAKAYREFWAQIVETNGKLDLDKVARELFDYSVAMTEVGKAYSELTGGALSKLNTAAAYVIEYADQRYARQYADEVCDEAQGYYDEDNAVAGDALKALAEGWHAGAWTEYTEARERMAFWRGPQEGAAACGAPNLSALGLVDDLKCERKPGHEGEHRCRYQGGDMSWERDGAQ